MQRADALVYNDGGGHILIYERGDPWGSLYAYECKGCADGCVYNIRAVGSAYKAISRDNIANAPAVDDDLYGVVRTGTGSGMSEVHALERTTNYQSYSVHAALPLGYTGTDGSWNYQVADYNNDGKKDVWAIRKDSTQTQLHVMNGADGVQTYLTRVDTYLGTTGTDFSWVFLVGDYNKDGKQDSSRRGRKSSR